MNANELNKKFGLGENEVAAKAAEYENTNWQDMKFGKPLSGRPRIYEQPMQRISVTIPTDTVTAIKNFCNKNEISRSEFIRQAVTEKLVC